MKKTSIISSLLLVLTALLSASPAGAGVNIFHRLQNPAIHSTTLSKVSEKNLELAYDTYEECFADSLKKICEKRGYSDIEECLNPSSPPKAYSVNYLAEMHCIMLGFTPGEPTPAPTTEETQNVAPNKAENLSGSLTPSALNAAKAFVKIPIVTKPDDSEPVPVDYDTCMENLIISCIQEKKEQCMAETNDAKGCAFKETIFKIECGQVAYDQCK